MRRVLMGYALLASMFMCNMAMAPWAGQNLWKVLTVGKSAPLKNAPVYENLGQFGLKEKVDRMAERLPEPRQMGLVLKDGYKKILQGLKDSAWNALGEKLEALVDSLKYSFVAQGQSQEENDFMLALELSRQEQNSITLEKFPPIDSDLEEALKRSLQEKEKSPSSQYFPPVWESHLGNPSGLSYFGQQQPGDEPKFLPPTNTSAPGHTTKTNTTVPSVLGSFPFVNNQRERFLSLEIEDVECLQQGQDGELPNACLIYSCFNLFAEMYKWERTEESYTLWYSSLWEKFLDLRGFEHQLIFDDQDKKGGLDSNTACNYLRDSLGMNLLSPLSGKCIWKKNQPICVILSEDFLIKINSGDVINPDPVLQRIRDGKQQMPDQIHLLFNAPGHWSLGKIECSDKSSNPKLKLFNSSGTGDKGFGRGFCIKEAEAFWNWLTNKDSEEKRKSPQPLELPIMSEKKESLSSTSSKGQPLFPRVVPKGKSSSSSSSSSSRISLEELQRLRKKRSETQLAKLREEMSKKWHEQNK